MTTTCSDILLSEPVKFLGSTVLSFSGNLGFGSQESTLNIELVEDCEAGDLFAGGNSNTDALVGAPYIFPSISGGMAFSFGGIITNWTANESSNGKTYTVSMSDPRRLLENASVIVDTYSGTMPPTAYNVYNIYNYYEGSVLGGNCNNYGAGRVSDRGMPYSKVITALQNIYPTIYSPTGSAFKVNFSTVPSGLPEHYRVNGPGISMLQLITDVCEAIGYDFYVYLSINNSGQPEINFGFVNLAVQPSSFGWIIDNFGGTAIERSYGQELRIEKQKTMIIGEKQHYMIPATEFKFFFGENAGCEPVLATYTDSSDCGFNVLVNTAPLSASMRVPISVGNYNVTEYDLRCAMGSFELWKNRIFSAGVGGDFNDIVRDWLSAQGISWDPKTGFSAFSSALQTKASLGFVDFMHNPNKSEAKLNTPKIIDDFKKIHQYIESLGRTYYGKQFLAKLDQKICYRPTGDIESTDSCIASEMMYTAVPTNDGGWVEPGGTVLGVSDPYLGFFRQEDGRVGGFALFSSIPLSAQLLDEPIPVNLDSNTKVEE